MLSSSIFIYPSLLNHQVIKSWHISRIANCVVRLAEKSVTVSTKNTLLEFITELVKAKLPALVTATLNKCLISMTVTRVGPELCPFHMHNY